MTNSMGDTGAEGITSPGVVELFERLEKVMEELRPVFKAILETKKGDSRE